MSDANGEKEPDYQPEPRVMRGSEGKKSPGSKGDHDLTAAVLIMTLFLALLGLWVMTHMYP